MGSEKALGLDDPSTLTTVRKLGKLYVDQVKMAEAEQMYTRVLAGYEKGLGPEYTATLNTISNVGNLCVD
jgi:hypothetical protein